MTDFVTRNSEISACVAESQWFFTYERSYNRAGLDPKIYRPAALLPQNYFISLEHQPPRQRFIFKLSYPSWQYHLQVL